VKYLVLFHDCRQQAAYRIVLNILRFLKREISYVVLQESVKIAHWNAFSVNDESSEFLLYWQNSALVKCILSWYLDSKMWRVWIKTYNHL